MKGSITSDKITHHLECIVEPFSSIEKQVLNSKPSVMAMVITHINHLALTYLSAHILALTDVAAQKGNTTLLLSDLGITKMQSHR